MNTGECLHVYIFYLTNNIQLLGSGHLQYASLWVETAEQVRVGLLARGVLGDMGLLPESWIKWKFIVGTFMCTCMKLDTVSLYFFYSSGVFPYSLSHSSSYLDFFGGQIYQKNVYFNDFLKKNWDTTILFRLNFIFLISWIMTVVCCCFWVLFHSTYCPSLELCYFLLLQWRGWAAKYLHVWWFVFSP